MPVSSAASQLSVSRLRCEGQEAATAIDAPEPQFSWRLDSADDERGVRQTAYQLRVTQLNATGQPVGDPVISERVASDLNRWVTLPDFTAKPRTHYLWQVRVWDNLGGDSGWSDPASFETGLMTSVWPASWVGDGRIVGRGDAPAARYFRTVFSTAEKPVRARLYLSAFGLVEPWINGQRATDDCFLPGWPDYRERVFYVAYDVTDLITAGENVLGLILGEGWYSSTLMRGFQFGNEPHVSFLLELTGADGESTAIVPDEDVQIATGPILANSIYYGETFDARLDDVNWSRVAGSDWNWEPAVLRPDNRIPVMSRLSPPVRRIEELKPVAREEREPGVFVFDFGQNMVGWTRLQVRAPAGTKITLRFAEMLEPDGTLHTDNLRTARATADYIVSGDGIETWEPRFTFFGFRYVEVTGLPNVSDDLLTGVVLHSDLARRGEFECSAPLLNQLYHNTLWGQKGNFLEVPTDCPQRDERLGWTGDAQIFSNTALYNMDAGNFYRQWLYGLRDGYRPGANGGYPDVAPDIRLRYGSAGWGDAGVIIPWVTWVHTGDLRVLEENFASIQEWIALQETQAFDGIRRSPESYGDWLSPGFPRGKAPPPYELIATAYFARTLDLAARIAEVLGRDDVAARNRALLERVKAAFQREYIALDGRITTDMQTAYLLALGFDLVTEEQRPLLKQHLLRTIAQKDDHLSTGFLGTPLLLPVLADLGETDLAYTILQQESYPGWLFSVKNGATTIWERWNSWTPEEGFNREGMNSFNHYAYGSVVEWFYDTIAGLRPDPSAPGWKRFAIAPRPGGGLTHAAASVETPHGKAASSWRIADGELHVDVEVPANTEADVSLPAPAIAAVTEGGRALAQVGAISGPRADGGFVTFTLGSGRYQFVIAAN